MRSGFQTDSNGSTEETYKSYHAESWFKRHLVPLIVTGIAVVVILIIVIGLVGTSISVANNGNQQEAGLNTQYLNNQNYLSDCIVKINETAGVATAQANRVQDALTEVIKGRYDNMSANAGQMFSAVVEDYPDMQPMFLSAHQR